MDDTVDPLEGLVVNQTEVDRTVLANGLTPYVRIDKERRSYAFLPGVRERWDAKQRVVASLLARKALSLLVADYVEPAAPRALEAETGIVGGTLRPTLKTLADKRLVSKVGDGYVVPNFAIETAIHEVTKND
jgi:hypothetical protein